MFLLVRVFFRVLGFRACVARLSLGLVLVRRWAGYFGAAPYIVPCITFACNSSPLVFTQNRRVRTHRCILQDAEKKPFRACEHQDPPPRHPGRDGGVRQEDGEIRGLRSDRAHEVRRLASTPASPRSSGVLCFLCREPVSREDFRLSADLAAVVFDLGRTGIKSSYCTPGGGRV